MMSEITMKKATMSVTKDGRIEEREIDHIPAVGYGWGDSGSPVPIHNLPYPVLRPDEALIQTVSGETFIVGGIPDW